MSDADPVGLLDQAHHARADAARARRLARQQTDRETRITLSRLAEEMDAEATALEQQAFNLTPGMQSRAVPQQMQQARTTPAKGDDPD
jgi:hypothetical protein